MVRAVAIQHFGDPTGMAVIEVREPRPAAGQVVITTEAIGVGGVDAVIRRGTLAGYVFTEGLIPGSEVAGTVTAVGADVDHSWIGRRVWAFTGTGGGYVEQAVAPIGDVVPLPDGLSSINAVTLGSAAPVAHFALAHARFASGESVLVRGAAGSIGIAAVELAVRGGANVAAVTTSSPERGLRLRELGATHVLDRAGEGDPKAPTAFDVRSEPSSSRRPRADSCTPWCTMSCHLSRLPRPTARWIPVWCSAESSSFPSPTECPTCWTRSKPPRASWAARMPRSRHGQVRRRTYRDSSDMAASAMDPVSMPWMT